MKELEQILEAPVIIISIKHSTMFNNNNKKYGELSPNAHLFSLLEKQHINEHMRRNGNAMLRL